MKTNSSPRPSHAGLIFFGRVSSGWGMVVEPTVAECLGRNEMVWVAFDGSQHRLRRLQRYFHWYMLNKPISKMPPVDQCALFQFFPHTQPGAWSAEEKHPIPQVFPKILPWKLHTKRPNLAAWHSFFERFLKSRQGLSRLPAQYAPYSLSKKIPSGFPQTLALYASMIAPAITPGALKGQVIYPYKGEPARLKLTQINADLLPLNLRDRLLHLLPTIVPLPALPPMQTFQYPISTYGAWQARSEPYTYRFRAPCTYLPSHHHRLEWLIQHNLLEAVAVSSV